jgi:hypothetical protein
MDQALALLLADDRANSLPAANCCNMPENNVPTGLVMPAENCGFCLRMAASSVEPERGRPEMK